MKYEVAYFNKEGRRVIYGNIEQENGRFFASRNNPQRVAFKTFAYALAYFELVEALQEGAVIGFEVKVIA